MCSYESEVNQISKFQEEEICEDWAISDESDSDKFVNCD